MNTDLVVSSHILVLHTILVSDPLAECGGFKSEFHHGESFDHAAPEVRVFGNNTP